MTALRPWLSGATEAHLLKEGERIDILWADGLTSAHDFVILQGEPGCYITHHGTKVWAALKLVQFRKIPMAKKFIREAMKKRDRLR